MKEIMIVIGVAVLVIWGCISGIAIQVNHTELPGKIAEIEQLRIDVQRSNLRNNEDILGQAAEWNQYIASRKAYNGIWWSKGYIPNKWDQVELIKVSPGDN